MADLTPELSPELSPEGRTRQREMLAVLREAVVRRRRVRRAVRGGVLMACVAGLLFLVVWSLSGDRGAPETATPEIVRAQPPEEEKAPALAYKHFDFEVIGDDELLKLVSASRGPTGLVRVGDRAYLSSEVAQLTQEERSQ